MNTTRVAAFCLLSAVLSTAAPAAQRVREYREGDVWVRTVLHDNGTRTVSKKDINTKQMEKKVLNAEDVLVARSIFQIDSEGNFQRGQIFNGRGQLMYVSEFIYDDYGRLMEERVSDGNRRPVRRLVYKYDAFGKAQPFAINFVGGQASSGPVAVQNAQQYSSTSDLGYQANPHRAQEAQLQTKEQKETKRRLGLFRSTSKRNFRPLRGRK